MNCQCIETFGPGPLARATACRALLLVGLTLGALFSVPMAFARLDLQREALAGSDALLERGVIPPNQLDWIMVDCSKPQSDDSIAAQLRHSFCEIAKHDRS